MSDYLWFRVWLPLVPCLCGYLWFGFQSGYLWFRVRLVTFGSSLVTSGFVPAWSPLPCACVWIPLTFDFVSGYSSVSVSLWIPAVPCSVTAAYVSRFCVSAQSALCLRGGHCRLGRTQAGLVQGHGRGQRPSNGSTSASRKREGFVPRIYTAASWSCDGERNVTQHCVGGMLSNKLQFEIII